MLCYAEVCVGCSTCGWLGWVLARSWFRDPGFLIWDTGSRGAAGALTHHPHCMDISRLSAGSYGVAAGVLQYARALIASPPAALDLCDL